jgi:hypothetical protein
MSEERLTSEETRDVDRAEEYSLIYSRGTPLGLNRFELSTGIIVAARFADKLRRVALVTLSKIAPKDLVIREVSELNKRLYKKIVEEMKLDKLDIIRITVEAEINVSEKRIIWSNLKIYRYYTEEQCESKLTKLREENERLKGELAQLRDKLMALAQQLKGFS